MYENAQWVEGYGGPISIRVTINGTLSWVPIDPENIDYQNIMTLVAEGKLTIAPAEAQ